MPADATLAAPPTKSASSVRFRLRAWASPAKASAPPQHRRQHAGTKASPVRDRAHLHRELVALQRRSREKVSPANHWYNQSLSKVLTSGRYVIFLVQIYENPLDIWRWRRRPSRSARALVPASLRRSVRNVRAKELVRNETAGGANAIPNRGVMRIGRFWCREITYRPLVSTLERLWLYQWFAGETFSRERRRSRSVPYAGYFAGFVSAGFEPRKYPANTPQKNPARVTYSAKTDVSAMRSARRWLPRHFMFDMAFLYLKAAIWPKRPKCVPSRLAQTSKVRTKRKLKRTFGTVRLERPFGTSTVGPSSLTGTHLSRTVTHSGSRYTVYGPAEVESNG